jgi:hypothetical protein
MVAGCVTTHSMLLELGVSLPSIACWQNSGQNQVVDYHTPCCLTLTLRDAMGHIGHVFCFVPTLLKHGGGWVPWTYVHYEKV